MTPITEEDIYLGYGLKRTDVVVDVGGYRGDFTAKIDELYDHPRILCFEAIPAFYEQIRARFDGSENIRVINVGIGGESGVADMRVSGDSTGLFGDPTWPTQHVDISSMEEIMNWPNMLGPNRPIRNISLLKLNCEGSEYPILEHMLAKGLMRRVHFLTLQWHYCVPQAEQRKAAITAGLEDTHTLVWDHGWNWQIFAKRT